METRPSDELLRKAVQVAVYYNNRCCELEEIVEMFCMDAEQVRASTDRMLDMLNSGTGITQDGKRIDPSELR